ncbi:DNA-binding response regulator [Sporanaerobium hydrogeniformans]|uniref:DNA-binding response regulator n=1 Tax=Sporanaerobium hydrogeniformans TaxID=3072179 RepID=A0AC61DFB7_9FIRM|nr:response regulator [Sporanaerobium hydrogeniformans]PHV71607.1 DNA-binding response regulator [Sporanaerobium hydrogeniformans]
MYSLIIIDDELNIREGLTHLFPWDKVGFKIIGQFSNGLQALDFIKTHPTDVILTDIKMPVMTGIELSNHLVKDYPHIKFVFLTGYQDFSYLHTAIINHASDYLLKPIHYEKLYACFEQLKITLDQENHVTEAIQGQPYYDKIISTICSYIKENFRSATLEEAAILVNLSPNYLSKLFKDKAGTSFSDYLYEIRMKEAAKMLDNIQYKHYEIAYYVGYDNPKNFSRSFKQYYKMTPTEYREKKYPERFYS